MKLGYVTICWGKTYSLGLGIVGHPVGVTNIKDLHYVTNGPLDAALKDIKTAGFDGFECFDGDLMAYADRADEFKALVKASGLEFAGVYTGANLIYSDILPEELFKIDRVCALAGKVGAKHLVVGAGARRSTGTTDKDYDLLGQGLNAVADVAEKYGLIAVYHPHLTTMVETAAEVDKIMARTRISFCPDTAHLAAAGGDPAAIMRKHADRLQYVHLKDWTPAAGFLPLGAGQLDIPAMLKVLRDARFDGWATVELDIYGGAPLEAAKISRTYLASH
jgi:inosose dehydratase